MKIEMIKFAGGVLAPANDMELEKLNKFKNGEQYPCEIKLSRNPSFHRKVFSFFNFCFEHWGGGHEFHDEQLQFDKFRKDLTILAGFSHQVFNIRSEMRLEAKSLAYGNMSQEEFEQCYNALIQAALKHIFKTNDESVYNQLLSYF